MDGLLQQPTSARAADPIGRAHQGRCVGACRAEPVAVYQGLEVARGPFGERKEEGRASRRGLACSWTCSGGSALATHRSRAEPRLRERLFSRVGPDLTTTAH